jgi:hypothetical protein
LLQLQGGARQPTQATRRDAAQRQVHARPNIGEDQAI